MIVIKVNYTTDQPIIKVNYDDAPIYISTSVDATYINVDYGTGGGGGGGAIWGDIIGTLSDQLDLQAALDAKVPYTGATANVDLGEYELKAGQIELDQTPTGTAGVAVTRWNDTIGSTETTLKGGNVILKNGVDLVARIVNKVTPNTTLTKAAYQAVRISGAQGQRLAVAFAQANNDNNSADTIGLVTETIATNQEGFIMTVGSLEGINTTGSLQGETWTDGDVLYLSPTVAGAITNVKPIAPQHLVVIGYVEYAHANNGKIYVKVMNGWELGELHDVDTTGATNGQVLKYNGSIWTPQNDLNTGTVTSVDLSAPTGFVVSGNPITSSGTLALSFASGYSLPTTIKQGNWDDAYTFVSGFPSQTGNSGKYLTTDGSTLSWGTVSTANIYNSDGTLTGNRTVTSGGFNLTFTGSNTAASAIARGLNLTHTLVAAANNDTLVGLDINPTFTNGAFTGVNNYGLRVNGSFVNRSGTDIGVNIVTKPAANGGGSLLLYTIDNTRYTGAAMYNSAGTLAATFQYGDSTVAEFGLRDTFSLGARTATGKTVFVGGIGANVYMTLTAAGRLLLGTTTESTYLLDVNGTGRFIGSINVVNVYFGRGLNGLTQNLFIGELTGTNNTTGQNNTIVGAYSGNKITTGFQNTTLGSLSGRDITTSSRNTLIGYYAGLKINTGINNTCVGSETGSEITDGQNNACFGVYSGLSISSGNTNTLIGYEAGRSITTGGNNTFIGGTSGALMATGDFNIAIGYYAGRNIADGTTANAISNNSIFIGTYTKSLANNQTNQIVIGYNVTGLGSNTTIIGNSSTTLTALYGTLVLGATSANASAILQADSTTKGFLPPRMTAAQKTAISTPATGLVIYQTDSTEGLYQYKSTGWEAIGGGGTNIYNSDGTLTGDRTVTTSTNRLTISDGTNGIIFKNVAPFGGQSGWYGLFGSGVTPSNTNYAVAVTSNGNFIAFNSANGIYFNYNDSPKMYLSGSTGNFIIGGTTDAGYKLDVQGTGRFTGNVDITGSSILTTRYLNINSSGQAARIEFTYSGGTLLQLGRMQGTTGTNRIFNIISKTTDFGATNQELLTLFPSGSIQYNNFAASAGNTAIETVSSCFEIASTTKGFLPPRMTETQKNAISTPATGLVIYQTDGTEGLYENTSTGWRILYNTPSGGSGITRSVNNISTTTTAGAAASTDYVYLISGTTTLTLPTAVGNTNRYTLKNVGTNTVTINTTSSQTIDGSTSITMAVQYTALDVISDGTNWNII